MAKRSEQFPLDIAANPAGSDRRIYSDTIALPYTDQNRMPGYAVRTNARTKKRSKVKTTNVVGGMILFAAAALLYVGNVIAVNNLAKEVNDLTAKYHKTVAVNELLRTEINRKSSLDRISLMAQEELDMVNPSEAPAWFEVDRQKVQELENAQ